MPADSAAIDSLAGLRGLRTAPVLGPAERRKLRAELDQHLAACDWFTIGVMAPSAGDAVAALRSTEAALGWTALVRDPCGEVVGPAEAGVFLKGNQNTGRYLMRSEAGLGSGILISGHNPVAPGAEDTWGPLPLDLFS